MKHWLTAFILSLITAGPLQANDAPLVAAASSLRQVWPLLINAHNSEHEPRVTFGSSGNLARQIAQGAPFELFLSADKSFIDTLHEQGKTSNKPAPYAAGALAWVAPEQSSLAKWIIARFGLESDEAPFPINSITRLTIANPAFAPYGRAAQQVLDSEGITDTQNIKLSLGENAAQAMQFTLSGASDGGIVPLALVHGAPIASLPRFVFAEIPHSSHEPLIHSMVLTTHASDNAKTLFAFLLSKRAQQIFIQNGFRAIP